MDLSLKRIFPWFLLTGIVVNGTGLLTPILEPDGALYAGIAKRIVLTNDWINLYANGQDWLDKPHFPFWITALSYTIFGINSFAYKFPAFLFWLIGIRFTYLVAKKIYNENVARISVAIYVIALHGVISNFDVRAEPYLTTLTIGGIYYTYRLYKKFTWTNLFASAVFAACAVMTKGIFILLTVAGGLIVYWIITRQWRQFRSARWWILGLLILIFITPELYCLYVQFDLHPEKVVYGCTGVSGLRFFFWDSQFGRFFNTGPIQGKGDPSFFLHTLLWAFLPWSLLFYYAFIRLLRKKTRVKNPAQWIVYGSAGLSFLLFSLSRFQLPHYIIIFFPQLSMMVADELASTEKARDQNTLLTVQKILVLLAVLAVAVASFYGRLPHGYIASGVALAVMIITFIRRKRRFMIDMLLLSYAFAIAVCLFLNLVFYPLILQYEAGMYAAKWLNQNN
ncbi:MAG TPA: glycosyltransferase family 39 protein, partial [Parafilimonas sp.]|nr:glycosyltransferase family 39 protein [Parafilimonas sp.]